MMKSIVTEAVALIHQMDNDDLNQIIDAVKLKRTYLTRQATRSISIGDAVKFTSTKTGRLKTGRVTKVARKYITVDCGSFDVWRVPGNMLEVL